MSTAIELSHVTQRFGRKTPAGDTRKTVLDDVSLEVPTGQILCLLGPSGCGKTTMVDLVMGNTVPVAGTVRVLGETAPYPTARRRVGYMPQDDALYDDVTAEENLRFFGAMYGLGGARLSERIDAVLDFARLADDRKKLVGAYSGGMKRRLSLGAALLHEPEVLVLDEPTVGLDPDHRVRIWEEFARMAKAGVTLLVTTHVMDEAARCDRIAMLHGGRVVACAPPGALLRRTGAATLEEAFLALVHEVEGGAGAGGTGAGAGGGGAAGGAPGAHASAPGSKHKPASKRKGAHHA